MFKKSVVSKVGLSVMTGIALVGALAGQGYAGQGPSSLSRSSGVAIAGAAVAGVVAGVAVTHLYYNYASYPSLPRFASYPSLPRFASYPSFPRFASYPSLIRFASYPSHATPASEQSNLRVGSHFVHDLNCFWERNIVLDRVCRGEARCTGKLVSTNAEIQLEFTLPEVSCSANHKNRCGDATACVNAAAPVVSSKYFSFESGPRHSHSSSAW